MDYAAPVKTTGNADEPSVPAEAGTGGSIFALRGAGECGKIKKSRESRGRLPKEGRSMAKTERIERKPEYDAEDWEAVGKLKEYVEGLGFTLEENEDRLSGADCRLL